MAKSEFTTITDYISRVEIKMDGTLYIIVEELNNEYLKYNNLENERV